MGEPDKTNLTAVISVIDAHIPSMSDDNEDTIRNFVSMIAFDPYDLEKEPADLAIRTCRCGAAIDGFYEYVDHLKAVLRQELTS